MWGKRRKLYVFKWDEPNVFDPACAFAVFANQPYSLFFDSALDNHPLNTQSFICIHPFETIESKDRHITHSLGREENHFDGDPLAFVQNRLDALSKEIDYLDNTPFFSGGAAGYFGYDLARGLERLPSYAQDNPNMPDMIIGFYDQVIRHDHKSGETSFCMIARSRWEAKRRFTALKEQILQTEKPEPYEPNSYIDWIPARGDAEYRQDIRKVIEYIYAGDMYQACLSRRFSAALPESFDHYAHYCHLRAVNPAPFASYMNFGDIKLASASPERFLKLQDRKVETRPIKGTLKISFPASDLENSAKNRAENAMIVDLLRNDLSKVCTDFSVDVPALCGIETYEGLHHLVSVVTGELRADHDQTDLIKACFPGGSISGAPKVRAMEILEELEPHRRGPWCGSMGILGFNGNMDLNIAIRTIVHHGDQAHIQTGGGITAKSDANDELEETLLKAEKLFESFGGYFGTDEKRDAA